MSNDFLKSKLAWVYLLIALLALCALIYLVISPPNNAETDIVEPVAIPTTAPTLTPTPFVARTPIEQLLSEPHQEPTPEPTPSLPALNQSDAFFTEQVNQKLSRRPRLTELFVGEESIRKWVRAIYQLSQGNVVKEFRPTSSPEGRLQTIEKTPATQDSFATYVIASHNAGSI